MNQIYSSVMKRKSDTSYYQTQFLISIPTDLTGMTNEDGFFFFFWEEIATKYLSSCMNTAKLRYILNEIKWKWFLFTVAIFTYSLIDLCLGKWIAFIKISKHFIKGDFKWKTQLKLILDSLPKSRFKNLINKLNLSLNQIR